ncbi:S-layer homology domain-containing protein [Paenarthrobacter nitroguajacolicus]|uniref:S-layer homology domain-containing protein n=1 Tax=Paenarthrobacter nitroguajacolicus TaxID=211146 RepID=UPI0034192172
MSFLRIRHWRAAAPAMIATLTASLVLGMVPAQALTVGRATVPAETATAGGSTGGSISGTVTVRSNVDLGSVSVFAINLYSPSSNAPSGTVNPDGTYTLPSLPAAEYKVYFHSSDPGWTSMEVYGGSDLSTSTPVLVNEGQDVTGIDQNMGGGRIQGRVLMPYYVDTTTVVVEALDSSGTVVASEFPSSGGYYDLRGIPDGLYRIRASGGVVTSWHGGGASFAEASTISIAGEQDVYNADLAGDPGSSISGWVSSAWPATGAGEHRVSVHDLTGKVVKDVPVNSSFYTVSGLQPGQYKLALDMVTVSSAHQAKSSYEGQYYSGASEDKGPGPAQTITLTANEQKTRFDFSGTDGGSMKGYLRDASGHPLPFAVVEAYTRDDALVTRKAVTDAQGRFEITGLTTGSYRLRGNTTNVRFAGLTYSGSVAEQSEAKEIAVSSGTKTDVGTVGYWSRADFTDVFEGQQFDHQISWMKSTGISTGWPDATFRPLLSVNRDAMAAFLYRLAGQPAFTPPATSPFVDVPTTNQFYKEIAWLASTKISGGWPDKTFRPVEPVNRDAMAAFLYRFSKVTDFEPPATSPFTDVPANGQFYKEIAWLASAEISTGWDDHTYRPVTPVKRDAMAAFMYRFNALDK